MHMRGAGLQRHSGSARGVGARRRRTAAAASARPVGGDAAVASSSAASAAAAIGRSQLLRAAAAGLGLGLGLTAPRPAGAKSSIVAALEDGASGRTILTTASGIKYTDLAEGHGATPRAGDLVMCDVVLALEDGTTVLDTRAAGAPIAFQVGITSDLVPEGLDEVVRSMAAGTTRLAVVPAALGYGASGARPRGSSTRVPGNADLYYEVELLRCQGTPLGLACCSEAQFGERGGACIPEETLRQLQSMMGPGES